MQKKCKVCGDGIKFREVVEKYEVPFVCKECGGLYIKTKMILDRVCIWPDKAEDKYRGTSFFIPENWKPDYKYKGLVLDVGPGYYDKKGEWNGTELKVGMRILFNRKCPWKLKIEDIKGELISVPIVGERDVLARIEEE